MKKISIIALAAIATISSCTKDGLFTDKDGREEIVTGTAPQVFNATMEGFPATRATLDGMTPSWEVGDVISIDGHSYTAQTAGTSSTFEGTGAGEAIHHAYFPAGLYNGGSPALPSVQTYEAGKFDMPMYATSTTTSLSFKNLCGVLKITVTNAQLTSVKSITVSSTNCATSGAFTVSGDAVVLTEPSKTANTATVTYTDAVTTDATGKVFYVAIPAQTYQNLSIAVSDGTTTKVMTTKSNQNITVDRNTVYPIAFVGSLTTTGTAERTGGNVKWIQLWKDGPKFAEMNLGATNATEVGNTYQFSATGANDNAATTWGDNWRTPSKDQMNELLLASQGNSSSKVTCNYCEFTQGDGKWGFKFTGKEPGYTDNSVFFPAQVGNSYYGNAYYWSGTANGPVAWGVLLYYDDSSWRSVWGSNYRGFNCLVRPVLVN